MPYKSESQRGKFHALLKQGKISKATVDEFDKASKGLSLPDHVKKSSGPHAADANKRRDFFRGKS